MELITRQEAKRQGLRYYFTGKLCPNNHISKRSVHNATCYRCKSDSRNRASKGGANQARYRASKLNATPNWVNLAAIKEVYINCPDGFEVDHIIPLRGKTVCGLHVAWNLQYLTKSENCSKGNRL